MTISTNDGGVGVNNKRKSLNDDYPVNSIMEITVTGNEKYTGLVYCTDDISNTIVLKKSVNYTTLSSDIWVLNANSVLEKKVVVEKAPDSNGTEGGDSGVELSVPLLYVSKKDIENREKRAIDLAKDSFRHINQKVRCEPLFCAVTCFVMQCGLFR